MKKHTDTTEKNYLTRVILQQKQSREETKKTPIGAQATTQAIEGLNNLSIKMETLYNGRKVTE